VAKRGTGIAKEALWHSLFFANGGGNRRYRAIMALGINPIQRQSGDESPQSKVRRAELRSRQNPASKFKSQNPLFAFVASRNSCQDLVFL